MNAASVSALLRRGGLNPLGSGTPASREGIRVTGSTLGGAYIRVGLDSDIAAARAVESVLEICSAAGLVARQVSDRIVHVTAGEEVTP